MFAVVFLAVGYAVCAMGLRDDKPGRSLALAGLGVTLAWYFLEVR